MNREKVMTFMKKSLRFLPDKAYIKLYYRLRVGRKLNMHDPETLNEKLQWLKFNYRFPLQSIVSDKLLVRDYVKEKIGEEYLIPLLGSWEEYSDIDFSSLPKRFVLKCNHDERRSQNRRKRAAPEMCQPAFLLESQIFIKSAVWRK